MKIFNILVAACMAVLVAGEDGILRDGTTTTTTAIAHRSQSSCSRIHDITHDSLSPPPPAIDISSTTTITTTTIAASK
jgi:hypothetical protein